jgi:hypothetical protein
MASALQIRQNLGWNLFAATFRAARYTAKISYALPLHEATIVLPDFA